MVDLQQLNKQSLPRYTTAIQYYQKKKQEFEQHYYSLLQDETQNGILKFIEYIENSLGSKSWNYSIEFVSQLEKALKETLQGKDLNQLEQFQNKNEVKYGELSNQAKQQLIELQELYFSSDKIQNILQDNLQSIQGTLSETNQASSAQILAWAQSYCRQYLFNINKNEQLKPRSDILAGYYQEVLLHKGAVQLISKLKQSTSQAIHFGSKNTPIDEIIRLEVYDALNEQIIVGETVEYGGQSKLYKVPWKLKDPSKGREFYSITSNHKLATRYRAQTSFIKQLQLLQKEYRDIFYDNVFFVTNNVFTWTYRYIQQFRDSQYLLTIPKNNSDMIYWEKIKS